MPVLREPAEPPEEPEEPEPDDEPPALPPPPPDPPPPLLLSKWLRSFSSNGPFDSASSTPSTEIASLRKIKSLLLRGDGMESEETAEATASTVVASCGIFISVYMVYIENGFCMNDGDVRPLCRRDKGILRRGGNENKAVHDYHDHQKTS